MPSASRTHSWDDGSGDVIVVYERLEIALRGAIRAAVRSPMVYNLAVSTSADSWVYDVTDVRAVADRVGEPLDYIVVSARSDGVTKDADPVRDIRLKIHNFGLVNRVTLVVRGEDLPELHGVFEALRNQLTAEIRRATGAGESAGMIITEPGNSPPAAALERSEAAAQPATPQRRRRERIGAFFSHPTGSNVAGGLIVAALLALVAWIWTTYWH